MVRIGQSAGNPFLRTGILRDYTPSIQQIAMDLDPNWVVGFVDGEGCFHVSLNRQPSMTAGYQVLPEFVIVQHERDVQLLHALKRFFRGGVVRRNHGDRFCLRIRKLDCLIECCGLFQRYPLRSKKAVDFAVFRKVIQAMVDRKHLSPGGLIDIVDLVVGMNTADRPRLLEIRSTLDKEIVHAGVKASGTS